MDQIKLNMKFGPVEFQYEGSEAFAKDELLDIIEQIASQDLQDIAQATTSTSPESPTTGAPQAQSTRAKLSTTDFAVKMNAKSGTDLVMAASAYLHHTSGLEDFRRSDILNAMKGAKAFYRASYGSNLSKSLDSLTKSGRLQNPGSDTFALPYSEIEATQKLLQ